MKKLEIPLKNISVKTIFEDCNKSYTVSKKHFDCNKYLPKIIYYTIIYQNRVPNNIPALKQDNLFKENDEDKKLLIDYYKNKFVTVPDIRKKYYDVIKANAKGVCPICGRGSILTLDHYLPKANYPLLCLSPINLIPCCRDCNTNKLDFNPAIYLEAPIHPYLEEIDEIWLEVDITFKDDSFECQYKAVHKNIIYKKRLDNFLKLYKLDYLFPLCCIPEIDSCKKMLKKLVEKDNSLDLLKERLTETIDSYQDEDINSWKSALYRGLLKNIDDFANWLRLYG